MKESSVGIYHLITSFRHSISGMRIAFRESAVRQEVVLGIVTFLLMYVLDIATLFKLAIGLSWGLVIVVELVNTAVEYVVDLVSPEYNELAKCAKDVASAAVFVSLLIFAVVWVFALFN